MNWYYLEHALYPARTYGGWIRWLCDNVGCKGLDWKWDDHAGHYFICFRKEEDATAFKLRFDV